VERDKEFMAGGEAAAGWHVLGAWPSTETTTRILIVEGLATGVAVHAATDCPTVIAFSVGQLEAVARTFRAHCPRAQIVLAVDNGDAGQTFGTAAANAVGGVLALCPLPGADYNDLQQVEGIEAVRAHIERQMAEDARQHHRSTSPSPHSAPMSNPNSQTIPD